jgi:hypothetical protein
MGMFPLTKSLLAAALIASVVSASGEQPTETSTTLCALAKLPSDLVGQTARIKATYTTDFQHFTFLEDKMCVVDVGNMSAGESSVASFQRAVDEEELTRTGVDFVVDISVVLRVDEHWQPSVLTAAFQKPGKHGFLDIVRVWSFTPVKNAATK